MKSIVFATSNVHKIKEVNDLLGDQYQIISLAELGQTEDIPETGDTLAENAVIKAQFVKENYDQNCFSEDSGLEIDALDGAPGVYTARYAGPKRDSNDNMDLVLTQLQGKTNRSARFRTVIALLLDGETHLFEGVAEGQIATKKSGAEGFGYDPIFIPNGFNQTFAEIKSEEKNAISHRAKAVKQLIEFLKTRW